MIADPILMRSVDIKYSLTLLLQLPLSRLMKWLKRLLCSKPRYRDWRRSYLVHLQLRHRRLSARWLTIMRQLSPDRYLLLAIQGSRVGLSMIVRLRHNSLHLYLSQDMTTGKEVMPRDQAMVQDQRIPITISKPLMLDRTSDLGMITTGQGMTSISSRTRTPI